MITSIKGRKRFSAVRQDGYRVRSGSVRMKFLPLEDETQVAFALGRSFGNAVERNRGRRRLNSAFREAFRQDQNTPAQQAEARYRRGAYLLAGNRGLLTDEYTKIGRDVTRCLSTIASSGDRAVTTVEPVNERR